MTLYEINSAIENFEFKTNEDGEICNVEELDKLNMERNKKIENIALYIKNLKADAEALNAEKKAFEERQRQTENKVKRLTEYLGYCLGGEKFKTARCSISYRKSESVECGDIDKVPEEFLRFSMPTLDKTVIKKAIKAGNENTGCHLEEHINVTIK